MNYRLLIFLVIVSSSIGAQNWTPLAPSPNQDGLELNPLKGLTPLYNVSNEFPHSIRGLILGFDAIVSGLEDEDFNWDLFDEFLDEQGQAGRFGYLQVNVDMGFNRSDLPAFLDNVDRIYYDGNDPEDAAGVPSMVVNYNDEEMMTAMLRFIEEFGEKYNDDPRVFMVHYGLYGIFGEWDLGFGGRFVPEGEDWELTEINQRQITDAYAAAFDQKNLLARFPENVPEPQAVGYSDGLYFGASISDDPAYQWFFHPKLVAANADQNWINHPIGGEIDPDVQPTIWEEFPNTVIGLPGVSQATDLVFNLTRPTFLFQDFIFNDITQSSDPVMWENALKATRRTGYTFHINEYRLSAAAGQPSVEVNIQNTGLAPMYADWEVEFAYLGSNGELISLGTDPSWNISTIQPNVTHNYRVFASALTVPDGTHTFLLRVVNPLAAISAQAQAVRFDNATQDVDYAGWLTLGDATIVNGSFGQVPVSVTDLVLTPTSATMGLADELQLTAEVLPTNATNPAVTWLSNRPATASVDQNGLVTTHTLGGEVIITAMTQDGGIARTATITVDPYWNIPGLVEAEGYSDLFNAQVDAAPDGEPGQSVLGSIGDDTWMEYRVRVTEETEFVLDFRASSPFAVGVIDVLNAAGQTLTSVNLTPATASYDDYANYTSPPFVLAAGIHTLRLDVVASAFNLNWVEFMVNQPLPIALTQLAATPNDRSILIEWLTSMERENEGFHLERSTEASPFRPIAWIDGAGNSATENAYRFTDENVAPNHYYFYRLAQVDWDGTVHYSEIVGAQIKDEVLNADNVFFLYPNPATDRLSIGGLENYLTPSLAHARMLNAQGQVVIPKITDYQNINLSNLPAGIYLFEVEIDGTVTRGKFIKR